jgi:hypothetical protein
VNPESQASHAPKRRLLTLAQVTAGAAVLLALARVVPSATWSVTTAIKLASLLLLAACVAGANRRPGLRIAAVGSFVVLAAFNIGQYMRGETDCGCFLFDVPPMVTAAFDGVVAFLLGIGSLRHYGRLPLVLAALTLVGAGLWFGYDGRLRQSLDARSSLSAITVGTQLTFAFPELSTILVVDSSCRKCRAVLQSAERSARTGKPLFVLNLGTGDIQELSSGLRVDPARARSLAEQFAGAELPLRLQVSGKTVLAVEPAKAER